ncbi:MAG: flagellar basal body protein FliL [Deltaproteobacteria bacterium]|nr:MAG: flagellar basal body protein FliL [Deltaproteobacteria bacterium]
MAEEKEDKKEETTEKKKSPMMLIILLLLVILVLGGAAAGYFLFMAPKTKEAEAKNATKAAPQAHQVQQGTYIPQRGTLAGPIGPIKDLDTFIVNLTDAQGTRYLKVKIGMELSSDQLSAEIDKKLPQVRDEIITLLSSKSFADVSTVAGKRELKREIISAVNRHLATGQVVRIYFTEFVIQ